MRYTNAKRKRANDNGAPSWRLFLCAWTVLTAALAVQSALYANGTFYEAIVSLGAPIIYSVPKEAMSDYPESPRETAIILERVQIDEGVSDKFIIELIESPGEAPSLSLGGAEPTVLIYHTHTTEAYRQTDECKYEEAGEWRTRETDKNIVSVGDVLAKTLLEHGITALHDTTDHEPPKLSTSYSRSVVTMERYRAEVDSLSMYIDVHRDAYGDVASGSKDFVVIDGKETARLMFVVGTGEGATGTGFGEMPDFKSNFALAKAITEKLSEYDEGLVRDIRVKTGRYNQHISSKCLLVEVGHNANTLEQAKNAAALLARAIAEVAAEKILPASGGILRLTP